MADQDAAKEPEYTIPMVLSLVAEATIKDLRNNHGIDPTPNEIVVLQMLGLRVECPGGAAPSKALGVPVAVGNLFLWPHTIGADIWWKTAREWFDGEDLDLWVLLYSLAHSRDAEAIRACSSKMATERILAEWQKTITATYDEIAWAIGEIFPDTGEVLRKKRPQDERLRPRSKKDDSEKYLKFISRLCQVYGGTPETWRWIESADYLADLLVVAHEQAEASGDAKASRAHLAASRKLLDAKTAIIERANREKEHPTDAE